MKRILIPGLLLACCGTIGCGNEKPSEPEKDTVAQAEVKVQGPLPAASELENKDAVTLAGRKYGISVRRFPDKNLPTVKDQLDQEFYDNSVEVAVTRDGEAFFSHTFTKETFGKYLTPADRSGAILMGMAYDEEKSTAKRICLAAQVGQPGTGEGPAFTVEIPLSGAAFTIERDLRQDTNGEEMVSEEV